MVDNIYEEFKTVFDNEDIQLDYVDEYSFVIKSHVGLNKEDLLQIETFLQRYWEEYLLTNISIESMNNTSFVRIEYENEKSN